MPFSIPAFKALDFNQDLFRNAPPVRNRKGDKGRGGS